MNVLVTGATGAVGPCVVQALCEAGHRVRTFSLHEEPHLDTPPKVEPLMGDIADAGALRRAVQDMEAVIHLAALLHIVNPPPELQGKYERINVHGTATVVEAARRAGIRRLVFFSTIAVYGASDGNVLTEESPTRPDSFYAQTKLDAEGVVLAAKREDGIPLGTVLRLGAVYGARIKGNYQRLLHAIARSRFVPIGRGNNRRTLVYDRDVARAALIALEHPDAAGKIFNVTDGTFHTLNDIIAAICQALGKRPPAFSLPMGPVRFAAGVVEDAAGLIGVSPPITRAAIDKYTEDIAVDSGRIQKELGFRPLYDLSAGWKETVREMRRAGSL